MIEISQRNRLFKMTKDLGITFDQFKEFVSEIPPSVSPI